MAVAKARQRGILALTKTVSIKIKTDTKVASFGCGTRLHTSLLLPYRLLTCLNCMSSFSLATVWVGQSKLYCVRFGECKDGVDFVRCSYDLGHQWLG